jgi:hypothetical protein
MIAQKTAVARFEATQSRIAVTLWFRTRGTTLESDLKKQSRITSPIRSSNDRAPS